MLYETLDADWHWYRYEYQTICDSIHCHGTATFKNDPGLCNLTEIVLKGFLAEQKCTAESVHDDTLQQQINKGKQTEQTICQYVDWLPSTENPCPPEDFDWVKPAVHPRQVSYDDIGLSECDEDYTNLLNTVQRHTKCNSVYCLRRKTPNKDMTCRFNFPFEKYSQTYIQLEQITSKDETEKYHAKIVTKRNDPRLNSHQRIQLQGWRANCDIQVVIDYTACLEYLTKYASKPETRAPIVNNLLNSILSSTDNTSTKLIKKTDNQNTW